MILLHRVERVESMLSTNLQYHIVYSKRRTVGIEISPDGTVTVRAPLRMPEKDIEQILMSKLDWIEQKRKMFQRKSEKANRVLNTEYEEGSLMPFRGERYPIHRSFHQGLKKPIVSFDGNSFTVRFGKEDKDSIRQAFLVWYKKAATNEFLQRVDFYKTLMQETVGTVRIKDQKSCYGSCSSKRNLNFNWKCILAPSEVLDYIVVHELCHLRHMNHSKEFWAEVEGIFPNYAKAKRWLKENGILLEI